VTNRSAAASLFRLGSFFLIMLDFLAVHVTGTDRAVASAVLHYFEPQTLIDTAQAQL
jgi:hypothetical protein